MLLNMLSHDILFSSQLHHTVIICGHIDAITKLKPNSDNECPSSTKISNSLALTHTIIAHASVFTRTMYFRAQTLSQVGACLPKRARVLALPRRGCAVARYCHILRPVCDRVARRALAC